MAYMVMAPLHVWHATLPARHQVQVTALALIQNNRFFFFVFLCGIAMLNGLDSPITESATRNEIALEVSLVVYLFSCTTKTIRMMHVMALHVVVCPHRP